MVIVFSPRLQPRPHHGHPLLPPTPPPHGLPSRPSRPLTHLLLPSIDPFLPPQSQPKPSPTLPPSSSSAFSSLCRSRLYRSPRRTPLPPSFIPNRFYRSQALLCRSLDLLFFITIGQPLPSSLIVTVAPLCSARTLLPPLPLQPPQPSPRSHPLCHRGHLCSSPPLLTTPLPPLLPLLPSLP
ncbi:hypothetical protein B296_00035759 [Ensete ventricosum]|uniref:Uncharacterized protein n=1 Tax=Ensete ventricosum TaxID=4639 RepID=A0A426X9R4_ENSVE|nr:hypothetical protein B296_00035759 [Ensete ventricosum]